MIDKVFQMPFMGMKNYFLSDVTFEWSYISTFFRGCASKRLHLSLFSSE